MSRPSCHVAPPDCDFQDWINEPEGERLRHELEDWLTKNKVVSILLDTKEHRVTVDSAKLPPRIKPVLTKWGSIYVKDEDKS